MVGSGMKCKLCGINDINGKMTVSGIGPVCYECYQKPQKGTFRDQMKQKYGTIKPKKDHLLEDFK